MSCAIHGLRYDPNAAGGCVLCRRESGQAPPDPAKKLRIMLGCLAALVVLFIGLGFHTWQVRNAPVVQPSVLPLATSAATALEQPAKISAPVAPQFLQDGFPYDRAHDKDAPAIKSVARAASLNQDRALRRLLDAGAPIDELDSNKHSALWYALSNERWDVAQWLLQKGASAGVGGSAKETPLQLATFRAARRGDVSYMQMLLKHGADLRSANERGDTVLTIAAASGEPGAASMLQFLIEQGVASDPQALDGALCHAHSMNIRSLVLSGANVNATCEGAPILAHRVSEEHGLQGHRAVDEAELFVRTLLTLGADPAAARKVIAKCRSRCNELAGQRFLARAKRVATPPHLIKDLAGNTQLHHAAMQGNAQLIEKLVAKGLEPSALSDGPGDLSFGYPDAGTPVHLAAASCRIEGVLALIKAGAKIHAKDKLGREPQGVACSLPQLAQADRAAASTEITALLQ